MKRNSSKNSQSLRAQAAFRIQAKQRIAATGTPVENHAADLWSIFHFINPGLLGDFAGFQTAASSSPSSATAASCRRSY